MIWIAIWLYLAGLVGLTMTSRDIQGHFNRTLRSWVNLLLWPVTIPFAGLGDLYDHLQGRWK